MFFQNYGYVKLTEYIKFSLAEITGANSPPMVVELLLLTLTMLFITAGFMFVMRHLLIGTSRKIEYEIRALLFGKLLSLPLIFYQREQTGDLVSRLTNDLNDLRTLLGPGIMYIPNSVSRILFFLPVMFSISPLLIGITLAQMAVLVIVIFWVMPKLRPFYQRIQEVRADINNYAWQMIFGVNTIKLNTMEEGQTRSFGALSNNYFNANMRLEGIQSFTWPFFFFFFSLSQAVILFFGGSEIIAGNIRVEELLQFSVMISVMIFPIFSLGWVMSILQQGISAWERMEKIFHYPVSNKRIKSIDYNTKKALTLSCQNVSLKNENGVEILHNINLKIPYGKMIGITGPTGSGKTVLLEVLAGLRQPETGLVTLAGEDISELTLNSLYRDIAFSSQESFLFSTTIKKNIGFEGGHEPIQVKVEESARISEIANDIMGFRERYEQVLGERGINLSGGQKQRASLGRAVYKEAKILMLDDSLSAVDAKTEKSIVDNIRALKSLKTVIVVSHRVSLLKHVDEIVVMEMGKIVERGTHKSLIAKKTGPYARLVKLQKLKASLQS